MAKIVHNTKVYSRNFVEDFTSNLKNIIGGRLKAYERMVEKAVEECSKELYEEHPTLKDFRMQITEFHNASISVTCYGIVEDPR